MEITIYTPNNMKGGRKGEVLLRINRKSCFSFSKAAGEALGLNEGDTIALVEEKKAKEWYVILRKGGFALRRTSSGGGLSFNCASLANYLLDGCKLLEKSYAIKLATTPTELNEEGADKLKGWAILTSSAR